MQTVPCILHCENQVGIKIIAMNLMEGYSNTEVGLTLNEISATKKKQRCEEYIRRIQQIINTKILGDE
jgi:hypothetical protein